MHEKEDRRTNRIRLYRVPLLPHQRRCRKRGAILVDIVREADRPVLRKYLAPRSRASAPATTTLSNGGAIQQRATHADVVPDISVNVPRGVAEPFRGAGDVGARRQVLARQHVLAAERSGSVRRRHADTSE